MVIRRVSLAAAVIACLALAVSCRPNQSVEGQTRDAKIKAAVKSKLAADVGAATLTSVEVNVTNGVVTLAGPVHNEDEKSRAEAAARSVEGVASVTNALQILAPEQTVPSAPGTPALPSASPTAAIR